MNNTFLLIPSRAHIRLEKDYLHWLPLNKYPNKMRSHPQQLHVALLHILFGKGQQFEKYTVLGTQHNCLNSSIHLHWGPSQEPTHLELRMLCIFHCSTDQSSTHNQRIQNKLRAFNRGNPGFGWWLCRGQTKWDCTCLIG